MESKRQKYFKCKIERIFDENKTKPLQPNTKRRSSVTLLDSPSYHNQNKDLLIFNDPERITNDQVCSVFNLFINSTPVDINHYHIFNVFRKSRTVKINPKRFKVEKYWKAAMKQITLLM